MNVLEQMDVSTKIILLQSFWIFYESKLKDMIFERSIEILGALSWFDYERKRKEKGKMEWRAREQKVCTLKTLDKRTKRTTVLMFLHLIKINKRECKK